MSHNYPPPPTGGYDGQPAFGTTPRPGNPGTLDLPWYGIGFVEAVKRFFAKYARFDGRASRSEYWWAYLAITLVTIVIEIPLQIGAANGSTGLTLASAVLLGAFYLAILVPSVAIGVRRLHDAGYSGWFMLLGLVPCVSIVLIVFFCLPPKPEGAKYDRVARM